MTRISHGIPKENYVPVDGKQRYCLQERQDNDISVFSKSQNPIIFRPSLGSHCNMAFPITPTLGKCICDFCHMSNCPGVHYTDSCHDGMNESSRGCSYRRNGDGFHENGDSHASYDPIETLDFYSGRYFDNAFTTSHDHHSLLFYRMCKSPLPSFYPDWMLILEVKNP